MTREAGDVGDKVEDVTQLERRLAALEDGYRQMRKQLNWLMHHSHIGTQSSEPVQIKYGDARAYVDGRNVVVQSKEQTKPLEE
jgi:hypothetical protein